MTGNHAPETKFFPSCLCRLCRLAWRCLRVSPLS